MLVYHCDACGGEPAQRVDIPVDSQTDPADGKSETVYEQLDLCFGCAMKMVEEMVKSISTAGGRRLVTAFTHHKNRMI